MRKWWLVGAGVLLAGVAAVLLWPRPGVAPQVRAAEGVEDKKPQRTFAVTGTGKVKLVPDSVRCSFGVRTTEPTFFRAVEVNEAKVKKITEALEALKAPGLQVRVAPMNVQVVTGFPTGLPGGGPVGVGGPPGPPPGAPKPPETSYAVTHSLTVTAHDSDLTKLVALSDRILKAAVENGSNTEAIFQPNNSQFYGFGGMGAGQGTRVDFFREREADLQRDALDQALRNAKEHAEEVARAHHLVLGEIVSVTDQTNGPFVGGGYSGQRQDVVGEGEVTVTVSVTFALKGP